MYGSVSLPGVELFEITNAVGELAKQITLGEVSTDLITASGEPICTDGGVEIAARFILQRQEDGRDAQDKILDTLSRMIADEGEAIERRVVDHVMGALMSGNISSILANQTGTVITTRKGETIAAHRAALHFDDGHQDLLARDLFASVFAHMDKTLEITTS